MLGGTATGGVGFEATGGGDKLGIQSAGWVSGETGVKLGADASFVNYGTIEAESIGVDAAGAMQSFANFGTIRAGTTALHLNLDSIGYQTVSNAGSIFGDVLAEHCSLDIKNSGLIVGSITLNPDAGLQEQLWLDNTGTIIGEVRGGDGDDRITNAGLLRGNIWLDYGNDELTNESNGDINGRIEAGGYHTSVSNAGKIDSIWFQNLPLPFEAAVEVGNTGYIGSYRG